jgi:hypothetical protein
MKLAPTWKTQRYTLSIMYPIVGNIRNVLAFKLKPSKGLTMKLGRLTEDSQSTPRNGLK